MTSLRRAMAAGALAVLVLYGGAPVPATAEAEKRPALGLSTPALIERAVERGGIDRATADRYLVAALRGDSVPAAYSSSTPFRGTLLLLELRRRLDELPPGTHRRSLARLLHPTPVGTDQCDLSNAPLPNTIESPHFYIEYNGALLGGGLTINDYIAALETSWSKEVDEYGWAAPPSYTPNPAPSNKYPVRIDSLGPALYGFVSNVGTHAGPVGNNPNTNWNEGDADASCMVLNSDYDPFPGTPLAALQATAAHEFNHSIQLGWGALFGSNEPDGVYVEGGATWMEDEVFDDSNDNYNFLWPVFEDDMGEYEGTALNSPYEYWVTFRGLSEPYGAGVAGGGEDIMQRFWELTSKNEKSNLEALDSAFEAEGTNLAAAYHSYAIAVKFNKPCGGGYQAPHCLEEGPGYVAMNGATVPHGSVSMNTTFQGGLPDHYSLNWIALPGDAKFQLALTNDSPGGRFRASIACDTGTGLVISPLTRVVGGGETGFVRSYDPATCSSPFAVVTNVTQVEANPGSSGTRLYKLSVTPPAVPSSLSVKGRGSGNRLVASGRLTPAGATKVEVTLFERAGGWKKVKSRMVAVGTGGTFRKTFNRPDAKRCRLEAKFAGDTLRLPSTASKTFRC